MSRTLGQPIIIENIVGAGGTTGVDPRDARRTRRLHHRSWATWARTPPRSRSIRTSPTSRMSDFEPIGLAGRHAGPDRGAQGFPAEGPQGIRRLREGQRRQAEHGACRRRLGVVHAPACCSTRCSASSRPSVPFNGTGPALNALIAGQVDYMCDQIVNAGAAGQGRQIKAYAIGTAERNPALPDVPTTQGSRPAGIPGPGLERAVRAQGHAAADPRQAHRRARQGARRRGRAQASARARQRPAGQGPARPAGAGRRWSKSEIARWTPVIKAAVPN